MDIDFHYHATFVAARYAGFSREEATTIASAAQTIDENDWDVPAGGRLTANEIFVKGIRRGTYQYKPQQTYTSNAAAAIATTAKQFSVWSAFHFLPGNFEPNSVPADYIFEPLWKRRAWKQQAAPPPEYFSWLCRPHSPMAVHLVRNCRDSYRQQEVMKQGFGLHLIGVTMHVFIDTWAHQDFIGPADKRINDAAAETSYTYVPLGFNGVVPPDETAITWDSWTKASWGFASASPNLLKNGFTGHGRMGTWPDHSALIYRYTPAWASKAIIRSNPYQYFDAFLHMVAALLAIRNNQEYAPFALTPANIESLFIRTGGQGCEPLNWKRLQIIQRLIQETREPLPTTGKLGVSAFTDAWNEAIRQHSERWRQEMPTMLGVGPAPASWNLGKSSWVNEAKSKLKEKAMSSARHIEEQHLRSLDYFKFNSACKLHYRSMRSQFVKWGLSGAWLDEGAYDDDFGTWRDSTYGAMDLFHAEARGSGHEDGLAALHTDLARANTPWDYAARIQVALAGMNRLPPMLAQQLSDLAQKLDDAPAVLSREHDTWLGAWWAVESLKQRYGDGCSNLLIISNDTSEELVLKSAHSWDGRFHAMPPRRIGPGKHGVGLHVCAKSPGDSKGYLVYGSKGYDVVLAFRATPTNLSGRNKVYLEIGEPGLGRDRHRLDTRLVDSGYEKRDERDERLRCEGRIYKEEHSFTGGSGASPFTTFRLSDWHPVSNAAVSVATPQQEAGPAYLAYQHNEDIRWASSPPGEAPSWSVHPAIPGLHTASAPALGCMDGTLYMLHRGRDNGIWWGSFDPQASRWNGCQRIEGWRTPSAPALAAFDGKLYLAYRGCENNGIYWATFDGKRAQDGSYWTGHPPIPRWATPDALALAAFEGKLYMAYRGLKDEVWWARMGPGDSQWPGCEVLPGRSTLSAPSLAAFGGRLYMAYRSSDANAICWATFDGQRWADRSAIPGWKTQVAPTLAVIGGRLRMLHLSTRGGEILWSTFDPGSERWSQPTQMTRR